MTYQKAIRRPDPRRPDSWCHEGVSHDHQACGLGTMWDSSDPRDVEEATRWVEEQAASRGLPYSDEVGWTDDHRAFRDWLVGELREAGCEIRTLSPEGMAQVTVEHMVRTGWEAHRPRMAGPADPHGIDDAFADGGAVHPDDAPAETPSQRPWCSGYRWTQRCGVDRRHAPHGEGERPGWFDD
jgi:hypothetical protein